MGTRDYSTTAASNLSVQGISLAEGMARASVNNSMRAQLADIADLLLDLGGATTTTGSANAYLLALDTAPTSLADNLFFLATSHASNTGASTINVGGLGVKAIEKLTAGTAVPIGAQDFPDGHVGIFTYSSANNSFLMLNPATALAVGAQSVSFETRSAAATAIGDGTIPDSIDIIEVLGYSTPGDDTNRPYTREVADPGTGSRYEDADGSWWVAAAQGLHRVDGVAALRTYAPIAGRRVMLAYHTTADDLGAGLFVGRTGLAPGAYEDNDGTIIVPTGGDGSAAWLRVWDGITAHVAWFGAKCTPDDLAHDDYAAVKKCFDIFTNGRDALRTGIIDVGPGFCFSQPLVYGGVNASGFRLVGKQSQARGGQESTLLRYTGPETIGAIIFYGANQWYIEDINTYPGNARNGFIITADNTYLHTTTHTISAGANRVVTPSGATAADKILYLQAGCFVGVDAGGDNFEIVYVKAVNTVAGTFTADFAKGHASGVQLGGSAPSSTGHVNRCRLVCSASTIWTVLTADTTIVSGSNRLFTVGSLTGVEVGAPLRVGKYLYAEVVYPSVINTGAGTFEATCSFDHLNGDLVMYPTAGILVGNRMIQTVQVDNIWMYDTLFIGMDADKSYGGIRQFSGGNVKAFIMHGMFGGYLRVPFAFERASGQYLISGGTSFGCTETLFLNPSGHLSIYGWEDESFCRWLVGQAGANPNQTIFVGCTMQGTAPTGTTDDEMFVFGGNLTFIGCDLRNARIEYTSLPKIISIGVLQDAFPSSVTLIGCHIASANSANLNFIHAAPSPGPTTDVIQTGTGKVTMLNCTGTDAGGAVVRLPDVLPPLRMWEGTVAGLDEPSIAAGGVSGVHAVGVPGAAMGDLVDASFSADLQGMQLSAWVSAADVVNYQFYNPRGGAIDLDSGTVKVRVRK